MGHAVRALTRPVPVSLLGLALCLLAVPLAGGHGILRREGDVLHYRAQDPGVGAVLTVTSPQRGRIVFKDTTSPGGMDWGPCLPLSTRRTSCPLRGVDHERIEVFDGPDVIHVHVPLATEIDAGDGPDRLSGGFGADSLQGGPGDDQIEGGLGSDALSGGPGDDTLNARDGVPDQIACGDGADTVVADPMGVDTISPLEAALCEQVERARAVDDRRGPKLVIQARQGQRIEAAGVKLAVSMSEPGSFLARGSVRASGGAVRQLATARGRPDAPGQLWQVTLRLSHSSAAAVRRALERGEKAIARVAVRGRDQNGNTTTAHRAIRLKG